MKAFKYMAVGLFTAVITNYVVNFSKENFKYLESIGSRQDFGLFMVVFVSTYTVLELTAAKLGFFRNGS